MNRLMRPERLDLDPSASNAAKELKHWRRTFDNFIIECGIDPVPNKHRIITNLISANVYEHVEDCTDFQSVIDTLDNCYCPMAVVCILSLYIIFATENHID